MFDVHGYSKRVESAKLRLRNLQHSELLLDFIDHLHALGLSKCRIAKYANIYGSCSEPAPLIHAEQQKRLLRELLHG